MTRSFDLHDVRRFTTGTIGPRGGRTFYLQVSTETATISLKLEKQQVTALAEYLETMMRDLPSPRAEDLPVDLELAEPVIAEWVVASMGVAWSEASEKIVLWAEALVPVDEDDDSDEDTEEEPATGRFELSVAQAEAFIHRARRVVGAGRPPCTVCGAPLNHDDGWCACAN